MIPKVKQAMQLLPEEYRKFVSGAMPNGQLPVTKRVFDASKVTDHHALLPTTNRVNLERMSADERHLWDMVVRRMLAAFYPPCEYDATKVVTQVGEHTFRTTGRVVLQNGWRDVPPLENPPRRKRKDEEDAGPLPPLKIGDERQVETAEVKEDVTKPPSQHTDASLLAAMESAGRESEDESIREQMKGSGIGTPATRAAIIERLVQVGYVRRKGKTLLATEKGIQLIAIMPEEIASPETTGRWEKALDEITSGKQDPERFMEGICKLSAFLVQYAQTNQKQAQFPEDEQRKKKWAKAGKKMTFQGTSVEGTVCPVCGKGKVLENERSFFCEKYAKGCHFTLWKDGLTRGGGPELNTRLVQLLLTNKAVRGSTGVVALTDQQQIAFYPTGRESPSIVRPVIWQKQG